MSKLDLIRDHSRLDTQLDIRNLEAAAYQSELFALFYQLKDRGSLYEAQLVLDVLTSVSTKVKTFLDELEANLMSEPKFVIVDDDNYRLSDPCETEKEARAQASFNHNFMPAITHVCRVCPQCGEHDLSYCSTIAYGLEACFGIAPTATGPATRNSHECYSAAMRNRRHHRDPRIQRGIFFLPPAGPQ